MGIKSLLDTICTINKHYEKVAKITGENFNVFKILKVDTKEVKLHSAFIAELLNPKGSHEQGNVFVKEFVEILRNKGNEKSNKTLEIKFDSGNAMTSEVEKWLGKKTDTEGGKVDIVLTDKYNEHIIIENKIYAGDQENQLIRYHSFDKNAPIVYLTLEGAQPSEFSTNNTAEVLDNLICISYKTDIKIWLKNCKEKAVNVPILRETITQYINLINHLSNQAMSEEKNDEIIYTIINNRDYIKSALSIPDKRDIYIAIMGNVRTSIQEEAKKDGLKVEFWKYNDAIIKFTDGDIFGLQYTGCAFFKEKWKYCVYIYFEEEFGSLVICVRRKDLGTPLDEDNVFKQNLTIILSDFKIDYEDYFCHKESSVFDETPWEEVQNKIPDEILREVREIIEKTKGMEW